ncbi:glycoside hydrolase family 28 protein [Prevotella sp. MA2016]|uniref:glycoside hydrolase family 28 protein n=1 Tax=Prevotella sp. MA2016 TaxID=1408310 RepID=UPI001E313F25|nr:glycosyl hydrolase family 28 protein [Prevotella sp. MA2016]
MIRTCFIIVMVLLSIGTAMPAWGQKQLTTAGMSIPADGKTVCTQQLQQAIDAIAKKGGGRLVFTKGSYLTGGLMLRSGVELHLEEGATLLGSTNPYDYQSICIAHSSDNRNDNAAMALIMADGADHISITGSGTIDGQGLQLALNIDSLHHTGERIDPNYNQRRQRPSETARPKLFFLYGCKNVTVEGVKLRSSANWGLSLHLCQQVQLQHLDIENRAYWNNDGIDLTDCQHVLVADCHINSADDGVCLKSYHADSECYDIEIARCDIRSSASAVKFGTASWGGFRKVYAHDIKVSDTFRSAIAIESVDGAQIDSVLVERVEAHNTGNPIFMRLGQRAGDRKGSLRNVVIRDLTCQVPFGRPDEAYDLRGPEVDFFHNPFPSSICGIPGNCIEHITLQNINITCPGRATKGMAYIPLWRKNDVPEQIGKYPEFTMFGELPAWGFYLRHVRDITFKNVQLLLADDDFRPAIVEEDVEGFVK